MYKKTYLNSFILSLICVSFSITNGFSQPQKGEFISANIGFGTNIPYEDYDELEGIGLYLQGEYVYNLKSWFGLRP